MLRRGLVFNVELINKGRISIFFVVLLNEYVIKGVVLYLWISIYSFSVKEEIVILFVFCARYGSELLI